MGSVVRVPLSGRRVRGFVVDVEVEPTEGLRDIAQISGRSPVFDQAHLPFLRWASRHYVAPFSVVLDRTTPPNNPPAAPASGPREIGAVEPHFSSAALRNALNDPDHPVAWVSATPPLGDIGAITRMLAARDQSLIVVAATAQEVSRLAERIGKASDLPVVAMHGEVSDREATRRWALARYAPVLLIGTPRVAMWAVHHIGAAIVIQEGRRAMKDRQTPTFHVRDLMMQRGRREGFPTIFLGPTPSVEVIGAAPTVVARPGRVWPLVEVVDRTRDASSGRLLTDAVRRAVQSVVARNGRVFIFAHRRGYAAATRCGRCRTIRLCVSCGSRPDPGPSCSRCNAELGPCANCQFERFEPLGAGVGRLVEEIRRFVKEGLVGPHPFEGGVSVGTERDLADLVEHDLVVFTDVDGVLYGTNYRAAEECLRIGARLALAVASRTGSRLMIQTSDPDHPVVTALRSGDPLPALERELTIRQRLGYPPAGELIVVELRGSVEVDSVTTELLSASGGANVLGPANRRDGARWLIQGDDLHELRKDLRTLAGRWRDAGAVTRIDVDPIDL